MAAGPGAPLAPPSTCSTAKPGRGGFGGPAGWWYDPTARHIKPERTRDWLTRAAARFDTDRLSYWTVRRRDTAAIIGVGGAQRQSTGAWNLNYRIAASEQGNGFATELGR